MKRVTFAVPILIAAFLTPPFATAADSAAAPRRATSPGMTYTTRFAASTFTKDGTPRPTAGSYEPTGYTAVVVWAAGRGRMDIVAGKQAMLFDTGDYLLFDSTETIVVHAAAKTFFRIPKELFGPPPQILATDVDATVESLGGGDTIGGYATQHYRVTSETKVMPPGVDSKGTTDYWLANILNFPPNPLGRPVNAAAETEEMPSETSARVAMLKRDRPMGKVPIKKTVTVGVASLSKGFNGGELLWEITAIKNVAVELDRLVLPEGISETRLPGMDRAGQNNATPAKDGAAKWKVLPVGSR